MDDDMRQLRVPSARSYEHDRPMLQSDAGVRATCRSATTADRRSRSIDVSFTIDRGQSIGIVGPTGAGKSTLVDVLLGLLPPTTGRVLIDGEPLEGRERAWQRQIGYVSQNVYLLDDSLRRNIAFGIPDHAIDEARLAAAVTQARLDEVVAGAAVEARDRGRRERHPPVGRAAPARGDRARAVPRSGRAVFRRGDGGARHADRARSDRSHRQRARHANGDRDRASALDREALRSADLSARRPRCRRRHLPGIDGRSAASVSSPDAATISRIVRRSVPSKTTVRRVVNRSRNASVDCGGDRCSVSPAMSTIRCTASSSVCHNSASSVVEHLRRTAAVDARTPGSRRASFPPWPCRNVRPPSPACRSATAHQRVQFSAGQILAEFDPLHRAAMRRESATCIRRSTAEPTIIEPRVRHAHRVAHLPDDRDRESRSASIREIVRCTETCRRDPATASPAPGSRTGG